jgi:hypothetical protein
MREIDGQSAWEAAAGGNARWPRAGEAFGELVYPVRYRPKFQIGAGDRFFCIGSCFARNIEEHLIYRGIGVLSRRIVSPAAEWPARPNGIVNKFTTPSMLNEVAWLDALPDDAGALLLEAGDGWVDMQLSPIAKPVSRERAIERRRYLTADYFSRLRLADVVVVTLGLNEVWKDNATGLFLNSTPPLAAVRAHPGRFVLHITTEQDDLDALEGLYAAIQRMRPGARFIVTVSPVPLDATFSGDDVVVANTRSKSVLRAAADRFCRGKPDVDYFPSFEMIGLAPRAGAFAKDCRHVSDAAVGQVIAAFLAAHGLPAEAPAFNEMGYLAANPEVDDRVRRGEFDSGFHHWQAIGRQQNLPLMPAGGPTRRMIKSGAV